jgi:5-methylcytosine-specific restriction endonuclease McrA
MSVEEFSTPPSQSGRSLPSLQGICNEELATSSEANCDVSFKDILSLISCVADDGSSALHESLRSVLLRVLEVSILRDPRIQLLAERWSILGARAPKLLGERIAELTGSQPSEVVVRYMVSILGGSAMQRGRRSTDYSANLPDLFANARRTAPSGHLRCSICGYHFQRVDLSPERQNIALSEGLIFASKQRPERSFNRDPWKPLYVEMRRGRELRRKTLTGLTIDHIVPEEGLGWSSTDNLALTCKLCNQGKMSYRWALEPLSLFGAGGLSDFPSDRGFNFLRQAIVVSAYRFHERKCGLCNASVSHKEITVRPSIKAKPIASHSLAPWTLVTRCYDCFQLP